MFNSEVNYTYFSKKVGVVYTCIYVCKFVCSYAVKSIAPLRGQIKVLNLN